MSGWAFRWSGPNWRAQQRKASIPRDHPRYLQGQDQAPAGETYVTYYCCVCVVAPESMPGGENSSIIGRLAHACKVVRPGHTFLRRSTGKWTTARVNLTAELRSDLYMLWWYMFLLAARAGQRQLDIVFSSDAWGHGVVEQCVEWVIAATEMKWKLGPTASYSAL